MNFSSNEVVEIMLLCAEFTHLYLLSSMLSKHAVDVRRRPTKKGLSQDTSTTVCGLQRLCVNE